MPETRRGKVSRRLRHRWVLPELKYIKNDKREVQARMRRAKGTRLSPVVTDAAYRLELIPEFVGFEVSFC